MARSQRSSAAKARAAVQQQLQALHADALDPEVASKKDLSSDKDSEAEAYSVAEESEVLEVSSAEESLVESSATLSESSEVVESLSEPEIATSKRRGRPRKGEARPPGPAGPKKYVKLSDFKTYGSGPFSFEFWQKAVAEARPMKHPKRAKRAGIKGGSHLMRPPTDVLKLTELLEVSKPPMCLPTSTELTCERLEVDESHSRELELNGQILKLQDFGSRTDEENVTIANTGCGAVSSLSWCRCCGKHLASASHPSADYQDVINAKSTSPGEILIWSHEGAKNTLRLELIIKHQFGAVRDLQWHPTSSPDTSFLTASFSDQNVRVLSMPMGLLTEEAAVISIEKITAFTFENSSCFSWSTNSSELAVGKFDGTFQLFDFSTDAHPRTLFSTKICSNPIWSLSWCPNNNRLLSIGCYDQSIWILDLALPYEPIRLFASINVIPNVLWIDQGVIMWDTDLYTKLLSNWEQEIQQHFVASFSSATMRITKSPIHNLIAASAADGSVHWMVFLGTTGRVHRIERRLFGHTVSSQGRPQIRMESGDPTKPEGWYLHPLQNGVTSMSWCTSKEAPGVLAAGTGTGLLVLVPIDSRVLAQ